MACRNTRPITLITPTRTPFFAVTTQEPAPGVPSGIIGGPQQPRLVADELERLALVPDVIAGGDHVDARRQDLEHVLARDAGAARGVLAVGDHEVGVVMRGERPHVPADQIAAGATDDVADEEQFHPRDGVSIGTRSPAPRRSVMRGSTTRNSPFASRARACAPSIAALILTARAKRPKSRSTR